MFYACLSRQLAGRAFTALCVVACVTGVTAQASPDNTPGRVEFDAASVKPSPKDSHGSRIADWPPGTFVADNISLQGLIADAYEVKPFQVVGGPDWVTHDRYHVNAKWNVPGGPVNGVTLAQLGTESKARLRTLLADRFGLQVHREQRELAAYLLQVASGGSRLRPSTPTSCIAVGQRAQPGGPDAVCGSSRLVTDGDDLVFEGAGLGLDSVTRVLSNLTDTTVVDRTGLTDRYDIRVRWARAPAPPTAPDGLLDSAPLAPMPREAIMFVAFEEQLGLRVVSGRAPTDVIVIDSAERPSGD
jgi:uncharacterized protein (TIGR03435 family)